MESGGTLKFHFLVVKSFLMGAIAVAISVPVSSPFCLRLCLLPSTAGNTDSSEPHTTPTSKAQVNSPCLSDMSNTYILNTRNKWHPSSLKYELWHHCYYYDFFLCILCRLVCLKKTVVTSLMFVWKVSRYRYPFTSKITRFKFLFPTLNRHLEFNCKICVKSKMFMHRSTLLKF